MTTTQRIPNSDMTTVGSLATAPAYSAEKTQPVIPIAEGQQQQPHQQYKVSAVPVQQLNPDFAFELDAVKATYQRFVTISLATPFQQNPLDLSSRGLQDDDFINILKRVKQIKSKSNTNKWFLWTSCIFCCGIIGWLLVDRRSVGNKKLKDQLGPVLEATNQELGVKGINVRFGWINGTLRGYFR